MLESIGRVRSPYREKFGVPRQSGLAPSVTATIELDPRRVPAEALRGLEGVSHLWVIFLFDAIEGGSTSRARATVRPPRLGGNERVGALATRSPFRPNPIGLSAVELVSVVGHTLTVRGGDFVDETAVLDIKPYLPWADAIESARCRWAEGPPPALPVRLEPAAAQRLAAHPEGERLRVLILESLRFDPRPAYHATGRDADRAYGVRLMDVDVRWRVCGDEIVVGAILDAAHSG